MNRFLAPMAGVSVTTACLSLFSLSLVCPAVAQASGFANFEPAQTNPIRLSQDGTVLFVVNTANNSLSVFNVTQPSTPVLLAEIPVGLGPVSVNPRTSREVWVVNQVSNSISIVSLPKSGPWLVTGTISLRLAQGDNMAEPMDVVFTGGLAYVSISRAHLIAVIDTTTRETTSTISLFGDEPRALAVSPDGSTVYAAFALAGNGTTILDAQKPNVPPQCGTAGQPQCVPPMNPALPPPPPAGLIVAANDPNWYPSVIKFTMPDNGVAAIKTGTTPSVSYYTHVGTINLGLAVNPKNGDLFVANTNALNLINFEPNLCGHWVNNQITHIQVSTGTVTPVDLNPGITYGCPPANPPADLAIALAQPTNVVFDPSGNFMYVAAFGTDRVAKVNTNGQVLGFAEVSLAGGSGSNVDPANKRGPRGLALNASAGILYSLNRIANTISIIPTSTFGPGVTEIPVGTDPTPATIKAGRGFLYDAKLSGTGNGSCASCHVDAEMDHLAWNLGDPTGTMTVLVQNGETYNFHPMKGPMTTQTLRGLLNLAPYHWRGDKPNFAAFNVAFQILMGGNQLSSTDMNTYTTFINSILYLPNPNRNLDNTLPTSQNGGNPSAGLTDFLTIAATSVPAGVPGVKSPATCQACHTADPGPGTSLLIQPFTTTPALQPMKVPQLRAMYQKELFSLTATEVIDGFGLDHNGSEGVLLDFLDGSGFTGYTQTEKSDLAAFMMNFDTGTAAAVGYGRTLTAANVTTSLIQGDWALLQSQAAAGNIDLIARGTITVSGTPQLHGLLYQPSSKTYISDTSGLGPFTQAQLQTLILGGDTLSIMGAYPGTGTAGPIQ
jgi:DNA-binding beta-propeller fold protein YncE